MKRILQVFVVVGLIACASVSLAAQCPVCDAAASDGYASKFGGQLARGVANTGLGWVELFNQPIREVKGGGNVVVGVGKGIGHACLRTVEGLGEILSSPMPHAKDGKFTQIADSCPLGVTGLTDR